MIDRASIINNAMFSIGVTGHPRFRDLVESLFDEVIVDAFANLKMHVNSNIATLNKDFADSIMYDEVEFFPYQLPDDMLFLIEVMPKGSEYHILNNILYVNKEEGVQTKYSTKLDVQRLDNTTKEYITFYLATRIAIPLRKTDKLKYVTDKASDLYDRLKTAQYVSNNDIYSNNEDFGIY